MSPVEMCGMPYAWASSFAWVPFPAPGGPRRMRIIAVLLNGAAGRQLGQAASRVDGGAAAHAAADAWAARAGEAFIVARDEVALDLLDRVERAAKGDAREDVVDVVGRRLARPDARDVAPVLLEVVRHIDRVEGHRRVEVGEEHDHRHVERVVDPRPGPDLVREPREEREPGGEGGREEQDRGGEDGRDDAGGVHLEWQVRR